MPDVEHWRVFPRGSADGNPCPVITAARDLTAGQMQAIAARYDHESGFVTSLSGSEVRLRYFVPRHEMRMCVQLLTTGGRQSISGSLTAAPGFLLFVYVCWI
jgi:PhzF family phenazine biosynthesis protein